MRAVFGITVEVPRGHLRFDIGHHLLQGTAPTDFILRAVEGEMRSERVVIILIENDPTTITPPENRLVYLLSGTPNRITLGHLVKS